jgi:hypothetical protein
MYPHARDLGVAWRLGVSTFLLVIPEGDEHEVMRRAPPGTTRPFCGRRHVTPRIAVITWGRGQTDSATIAILYKAPRLRCSLVRRRAKRARVAVARKLAVIKYRKRVSGREFETGVEGTKMVAA